MIGSNRQVIRAIFVGAVTSIMFGSNRHVIRAIFVGAVTSIICVSFLSNGLALTLQQLGISDSVVTGLMNSAFQNSIGIILAPTITGYMAYFCFGIFAMVILSAICMGILNRM